MKLDVKKATFSYGSSSRIIDEVSFSVRDRDVFCILGPNGAGKSTLLKCLACLLKLNSGQILFNGHNIQRLSRRELAAKVAYIPQMHVPTFPFRVLDVVLMGRTPHLSYLASPGKADIELAEEALHFLQISHLSNKPYTEISGGERQLVLIAAVLTQKPEILLLDEPTTHLDFGNQIRFLKIVKTLAEKGIAVLMSTHFPDHAFLTASKVSIMQKGRFLTIGSPEEVITPDSILKTYGIEVSMLDLEQLGLKICVPQINSPCFDNTDNHHSSLFVR